MSPRDRVFQNEFNDVLRVRCYVIAYTRSGMSVTNGKTDLVYGPPTRDELRALGEYHPCDEAP